MSETMLGRPRDHDRRQRHRKLVALLVEGVPWKDAARQAHVSPETVVSLLDRADFAAVAKAVIDERLAVAVKAA